MKKEDFLNLIKTNQDGALFHRENQSLEFKDNFQFANLADYAKTMVAFANNQGGKIIFGVSDSPRKPNGMPNNQFETVDNAKITQGLNDLFSPEINWDRFDFIENDKKFGVLVVYESESKPILCKKNSGNILREGDIYYRYRGRSEKIKYPELEKIFRDREEKEKKLWMTHIEKIAKIGPQNISMVDLVRGEIEQKGNKILLDKKLLKQLKYVKEYKSVEKDGAPALKIIGNVEGVELVAPNLRLDKDFFTTKELGEKLDWLTDKKSTHFITQMINSEKLKERSEFCQRKNNNVYYSQQCFEYLQKIKIKNSLNSWKNVKKFIADKNNFL